MLSNSVAQVLLIFRGGKSLLLSCHVTVHVFCNSWQHSCVPDLHTVECLLSAVCPEAPMLSEPPRQLQGWFLGAFVPTLHSFPLFQTFGKEVPLELLFVKTGKTLLACLPHQIRQQCWTEGCCLMDWWIGNVWKKSWKHRLQYCNTCHFMENMSVCL